MNDLLVANHYSTISPEEWPWKSFSPAEMACRHCGALKLSRKAMDKLAAFREAEGTPFIINSAYRCPVHNASLPGAAKNSQHLLGTAFDVSMANHDPHDFAYAARQVFQFKGIGLYPQDRNNFIHIDDRATPASWGSPFPERESRFAPEPVARPKTQAAKEASVTGASIVVAHSAATSALHEVAPMLPTAWVTYAAAGLAVVGAGIIIYRLFHKGEGH